MAINKHDDYEALAKLLYPSIEASGNVYYGQTRKLTLDEVLKRNSLGFDSHIESFYNESDGRYDSYFCWRLGSLHGSIRVDKDHLVDGITASDFDVPFVKRILYADSEEIVYDDKLIYRSEPNEEYALDTSIVPIFGTIFAKYRLDKHSTAITNELNSCSYDSYEVDVEPVLDGIYVTDDFNPVNSIDDDISDRHFYISKENGTDYLYIQILTNEDTGKILTFTALEDSEISLSMGQPTSGTQRTVFYRVSQADGSFSDNWELYLYDRDVTITPTGHIISISTGKKIQFKSDITNIVIIPNSGNCLKFVINSGTVFVSGSCVSMCYAYTDESTIDTLEDYALYGLFSDIKNMYGTPVLPNFNMLGSACYESMFKSCTSLTVAPKIKSSDTYSHVSENDNYCYHNMFSGCVSLVSPPKMMGYDETDQYYHSGIGTCDSMFIGCTNLKISPVIRYRTLDSSCCYNMFYGCSSLKVIRCGAKYIESGATKSWAYGVSSNGVFIKSTANYSSGPDGIPEGWTVVTKDDDYFAVHKEPDHGFRIDKHTPSDNYKNDYLVTSGTDSSTNGRGYIANTASKESTIGKMERVFDENNTHPMNTYNADGSFNQEIWGYKSFNSPVKFRNGLYSDGASVLSVLPNFGANILAYSVEDVSSGTMKHVSEINTIDYDLTIKFTGNARYSHAYATMSDTLVGTSIVQADKHIARFFSVDSTNIYLDIQSYMAGESTVHYTNNTVACGCGFVYSELTVPGKASVYAKEKPSINIITDGDSITERTVSSTVEAGIRVNEGVIQIEAKEGKPCNVIISTGNGDMDMMIEMHHHDKESVQGIEHDTSEVNIKLGGVNKGGTKGGVSLIEMRKIKSDTSEYSRISMGMLDESGSMGNPRIEISSTSYDRGAGTFDVDTFARIKADHVYIDGNIQVNGLPINNT